MPPDPVDVSEYSGSQIHPYAFSSYLKGGSESLLDWVEGREEAGGMQDRSIDQLIERARENQLKAYYITDPELYSRIAEGRGLAKSSGGFHRGDEIFINADPATKFSVGRTLGHEVGHELYSHKLGSKSVPKLNLYQKADRFLGGWLPSFSKYGHRPNIVPLNTPEASNFKNRKAFNKRMVDRKYHPEFSDLPFGALGIAMDNTTDDILEERISQQWTEMPDESWKKTKDIPVPREDKPSQKPSYIF